MPPVPIRHVDHVGVTVPSVDAAVPLWVDTLGGRFLTGGDNVVTGLRLVQLQVGDFKVELIESLRDDSLLADAIATHGTGLHHVTMLVDDVPAAEQQLQSNGLTTTGTDTSSARWHETFLRPADGLGTLLQFVATPVDWSTPDDRFGLADVLAGRVVWDDYVACLPKDSP